MGRLHVCSWAGSERKRIGVKGQIAGCQLDAVVTPQKATKLPSTHEEQFNPSACCDVVLKYE